MCNDVLRVQMKVIRNRYFFSKMFIYFIFKEEQVMQMNSYNTFIRIKVMDVNHYIMTALTILPFKMYFANINTVEAV